MLLSDDECTNMPWATGEYAEWLVCILLEVGGLDSAFEWIILRFPGGITL